MAEDRTTSTFDATREASDHDDECDQEGYAEWLWEEPSTDWLVAVVICLLPLVIFVMSSLPTSR